MTRARYSFRSASRRADIGRGRAVLLDEVLLDPLEELAPLRRERHLEMLALIVSRWIFLPPYRDAALEVFAVAGPTMSIRFKVDAIFLTRARLALNQVDKALVPN